MIENVILRYLKNETGLPCYMEEPEKPPKRYLLIEKVGSGEENYISSAVIAVQSYAESLYHAAELNRSVKKAMWAATDLDEISGCRLNSDYNYTDKETKRYRYQAVFDVTYYEE